MTQHEAHTSNIVMSSKLTIVCSDVYALFDPSASHSFVSLRAVVSLGLIAYRLECPFWSSWPKCNPSLVESIC